MRNLRDEMCSRHVESTAATQPSAHRGSPGWTTSARRSRARGDSGHIRSHPVRLFQIRQARVVLRARCAPRGWQTVGMRARDMAQPTEVIRLDTPALDALRALADSQLPGLVIALKDSFVVVPASQVLRVALPQYVIDDAALGRVWDEPSADALAARLAGRTLADLARALDPSRDDERPDHIVDGEANIVEIAAVMAAAHVPLVAVVDEGTLLGVITVNQLIGSVLA